MAIVIPELVLIKIINGINKHYWDNYQANIATPQDSLLYNMFGGLTIDKFDYFENIIKIFDKYYKEHNKPMQISLGWNPERMKYPNVCLLLPNEEVIAEGVSIVTGYESTNSGANYRETREYPYNVTYAILISSDNANETMLLYHYFKTIMMAGIEQLELNDFAKIRISGKDHTMQMDILPQQAHHRTVDVTFFYTNRVWNLFEGDTTTGITYNGNNTPPLPSCLAGSIFINTVPFGDVPSGGTVQILVRNDLGIAVGVQVAPNIWEVPSSGGGSSIAEVTNSNNTYNASFDTSTNPHVLPDVTVDIEVYNSLTDTYDVVDDVTFAGSDPNPDITIDA